MKAIAVYPGQKDSVHLAELPMPSLDEIPNGRGVLVRLLRVGVDGTDKEINAGEYGAVPDGYDFLTLGHENFGRVEAVGPNVAEKGVIQAFEIQRRLKVWRPRRAAVLGSGTIGLMAALILRLKGIEVTAFARTPAPYLNSDLLAAIGARYVSTRELSLRDAVP